MTAGNNGSGVPQDDDPFAYLYRQEGGEAGADQGAQGTPRTGGYGYPGPPQPGVPRTSYNHVRAVGERQYGQQQYQQQHHQQQAAPGGYGYGQQQPPQQQQQHGHYTAPEALPTQTWNRVQGPPPGGVPPRQQAPAGPGHAGPGHGAPAGRGGGGRGPNSKGLLIGAIAVVAVVIVGITVAMISNNTGGKKDKAEPTKDAQPTATETAEPSNSPKATKGPAPLPTEDASTMKLEGGTTLASDVPGAKADGGKYVAGINKPGAAATWSVDVEEPGQYRLYVGYGVPGEDQNLSLTVNSKRDPRAVSMKNFALAKKGDWEAGWTNTWAIVNLNKGTNTVRLSCESGNKCDVNLDRVWLTKG